MIGLILRNSYYLINSPLSLNFSPNFFLANIFLLINLHYLSLWSTSSAYLNKVKTAIFTQREPDDKNLVCR